MQQFKFLSLRLLKSCMISVPINAILVSIYDKIKIKINCYEKTLICKLFIYKN